MKSILNRWYAPCFVLLCCAGTPSLAAQEGNNTIDRDPIHGSEHDHKELEEVRVTATPLSRNLIEMSQSATVLSGHDLERELTNNIGDTLSRIPGLSNASFGQNVGRPVIRGFEGARVGVLNNNMGAADASAVSQDHAVSVEPFLADQVEVLKGPSTLLYGSGSIGGVVNVVTPTIPQEIPEQAVNARALVEGDSAADQRLAAGRVDLSSGSFVFHANGFYRRTDDYEIPGEAELYPDEDAADEDGHDEENHGILENSYLDNQGGSMGASWIGQQWRGGLAYTIYKSDYGIPGAHSDGHHEEEHEDEHESVEEHSEEEEENVTIGLKSRRLEAELVGTQPFSGFEQLKLRLADTGYKHTEFEGGDVGTVFKNDSTDLRLELRHKPWSIWNGAFGAQYTQRDFEAIGDEAFVPPSNTRTMALFWVESAELGDWQIDLGVRYDKIRLKETAPRVTLPEPENPLLKRNFSPISASFGTLYHFDESRHLAMNLSFAERAPTDQELFSFGPHLATQTFEVGGPTLDKERNLHTEIGYRIHQGQLTGAITFYYDWFNDYIFQMDTGLEEDELPVRQWSQQDATFYGGELELRYDLGSFNSGHWQIFGFADLVRAEFKDGTNVPRIPPVRFGLGADWDLANWAANVTWINASSHTRVAEYETSAPGYNLLNTELSYLFGGESRAQWEVYLKGHNLLNEDIRNSTSFLKDQAPQIGRNFVLGLRMRY
jgi:iron complex outermembrane receptor protein